METDEQIILILKSDLERLERMIEIDERRLKEAKQQRDAIEKKLSEE
jgi:hypothetical protein